MYVDDSVVIDLAACFSPLSNLNPGDDGYSYLNFTTAEGRVLAFSAQDLDRFESLVDVIITFIIFKLFIISI